MIPKIWSFKKSFLSKVSDPEKSVCLKKWRLNLKQKIKPRCYTQMLYTDMYNGLTPHCISKTNPDSISSPVFAFRIHFYFDVLFEVFYYHILKRCMKISPFFSDTESNKDSNFYNKYCVVWSNGCSVDLLSRSPWCDTRQGYIFDLA